VRERPGVLVLFWVVPAPQASASRATAGAGSNATFSTAFNYAIRLYPRFMTYFQQSFSGLNPYGIF
jgi:hypothetical protein